MLGFVLSATIIGTQKPTRQTQCALTVAIGVRRLRPAATASISFIVGGCSAIGTHFRRASLVVRLRLVMRSVCPIDNPTEPPVPGTRSSTSPSDTFCDTREVSGHAHLVSAVVAGQLQPKRLHGRKREYQLLQDRQADRDADASRSDANAHDLGRHVVTPRSDRPLCCSNRAVITGTGRPDTRSCVPASST